MQSKQFEGLRQAETPVVAFGGSFPSRRAIIAELLPIRKDLNDRVRDRLTVLKWPQKPILAVFYRLAHWRGVGADNRATCGHRFYKRP